MPAVYSLLHFPVRHRNLPLAGILLCEARTFLSQPVSLILAATTSDTRAYSLQLNGLLCKEKMQGMRGEEKKARDAWRPTRLKEQPD